MPATWQAFEGCSKVWSTYFILLRYLNYSGSGDVLMFSKKIDAFNVEAVFF